MGALAEVLAEVSSKQRGLTGKKQSRRMLVGAVAGLVVTVVGAGWFYQRTARRQWAREEAEPRVVSLMAEGKPLAAFGVLEEAERDLPGDAKVKEMAAQSTEAVAIESAPEGAMVAVQDYSTPEGPWRELGRTPLAGVRVPKGYLRWRLSRAGMADWWRGGMCRGRWSLRWGWSRRRRRGWCRCREGSWAEMVDFIGFVGPYKIPAFDMDRYEVTNREYQRFVDSGGYEKEAYWTERLSGGEGRLPGPRRWRSFAIRRGRPGPAAWAGGALSGGAGRIFPVSGVSWYEATAYAAFAGKSLPVLGQWYMAAAAGRCASTWCR